MSDPSQRLEETLRSLVAIDTTTVRPNAPLIALLEQRLRPLGFQCERLEYRDEAGELKVNLLARVGPPGLPELALVGHTDCVPYDPAWKEALVLTEKDARLYGRGACDTKAFVAAALHAAESIKALTLVKPLLLIFTADEEGGLIGAKQLVKAGLGKARYAIVGEPTSLQPIRGHKGYCMAEVEVRGKEGHSAYPESGASAIFRAARLVTEIEAYAQGPLRARIDPAFDPPYSSLNVGVIHGGRAKNVIPGECRFIVEWRPVPGEPTDSVLRFLDERIAAHRARDPGFEARVLWTRADAAVDTSADSPIVRFLSEQSGKAPTTVSFATEAPQLTELGAEAVVFGPGDIKVAHQTGEFVPVAELVRAEEILRKAIARFCAASA